MCTITDGNNPTSPPVDDAFIEWYYADKDVSGAAHVTGKFTFVASKAYLLTEFNVNNNYNGPGLNGAQGLPMLNCTNYSQ
jgi:hypothetical protein